MIKEKELNDDLETIKIGRQYTSLEEVRDVILDLARSKQRGFSDHRSCHA